MVVCVCVCVCVRQRVCVYEAVCVGGWMDGQIVCGWLDGWMDGLCVCVWLDGWMDGRIVCVARKRSDMDGSHSSHSQHLGQCTMQFLYVKLVN